MGSNAFSEKEGRAVSGKYWRTTSQKRHEFLGETSPEANAALGFK